MTTKRTNVKIVILIFLSCYILSSCNNSSTNDQKIQQESTSSIHEWNINSNLINSFYTNEYLDSINKTSTYKTVEKIELSEKNDTLIILLQQMNGWNDPGDFIRIKILDMNGNIKFDQTNFGGWVKFGNNYSLPEIVAKQNLINSKEALIIDNKYGKQLLVFGWVYASSPGLMTVIDLFPSPKIIFNREFELKEITDPDNNGYRDMIGGTTFSNEMTFDLEKMIIE